MLSLHQSGLGSGIFIVVEEVSMNFQSLAGLFSTKELILVGIILFMFFLVFFLLFYAVLLRAHYNKRNKYYARMQTRWEELLFKYIDGTATGEDISGLDLQFSDWFKFGEFIENYLIDLRGNDYGIIIRMLGETGYK